MPKSKDNGLCPSYNINKLTLPYTSSIVSILSILSDFTISSRAKGLVLEPRPASLFLGFFIWANTEEIRQVSGR